jgi:hypothetical protein
LWSFVLQRILYWVEWFDLVLCDNWFQSDLTRWGHDSFHIIDEPKYSDWCILKVMVALSSKLITTKLTNFLAYHEISWSIFRNNHTTDMEYGIQIWCRMVVIHNINMKGVQQMKWSSSGHMVAIAVGRDIALLSTSNWKLITTLKVNWFFLLWIKFLKKSMQGLNINLGRLWCVQMYFYLYQKGP